MDPPLAQLDAVLDDPILLAALILAVWTVVCAVALGLLVLLARIHHRLRLQRPPPQVVLAPPPPDAWPLVVQPVGPARPQTPTPLARARLALAVAAVLGFSALILASSAPLLLASLRSSG
jgi:hypothetical protein